MRIRVLLCALVGGYACACASASATGVKLACILQPDTSY